MKTSEYVAKYKPRKASDLNIIKLSSLLYDRIIDDSMYKNKRMITPSEICDICVP